MKKDWFETWFHSPYYGLLYYNRDRNEAKNFIDALLRYLSPLSHPMFLDLACGSGRHATYLASKGFDVTGIDLSDELIAEAKKHERENLQFFVHDMRNEFRINYFDYTLNLFTSFGYFQSTHDNSRVLKNVLKGLKPKGIFVLDFFNAPKIISALVKDETKHMNGTTFQIHREVQNDFIVKKIHIIDNGSEFDFHERVRAFTPQQLSSLFTDAGFCIISNFGSYELKPFSSEDDRFIIVAEKPDA